ncbi:MAG: glycosyltransferase [Frankiaceae bacterium]|nr:glycosyltransferase [Frankiaceae bacterium]MBV9869989.1 glycosyltransferase [Frankiaceae bacterium]
MTSVGCVVLSMGNRPGELAAALESVLSQQGVEVECLVVGNGWVPVDLPANVRSVALTENAGVTAARNVGAAEVTGDILFFLDDDAVLPERDVLARAVAAFDADSRLGVLQLAAVDPVGAATGSRHVPRLGGRGHATPGDVPVFWEGASLIRRTAFEAVGEWPGEFFYGHEGIEVAWRMIDLGYRVHYAADLPVLNPAAEAFRGDQHAYLNARNRVWVARRNLPVLLVAGYTAVWAIATLIRAVPRRVVGQVARGFRDGFRLPCGPRRPISWRTAWRLTLLGRPPVV